MARGLSKVTQVAKGIRHGSAATDSQRSGPIADVQFIRVGPTRTRSVNCGIATDTRMGIDRVADFAAKIGDLRATGDVERSITKTTNGEVLLDGKPACSGNTQIAELGNIIPTEKD